GAEEAPALAERRDHDDIRRREHHHADRDDQQALQHARREPASVAPALRLHARGGGDALLCVAGRGHRTVSLNAPVNIACASHVTATIAKTVTATADAIP